MGETQPLQTLLETGFHGRKGIVFHDFHEADPIGLLSCLSMNRHEERGRHP